MNDAVPNSSGTSRPRFKAPAKSCDSHIHVYDPRFKMKWPQLRAVENASVADYRKLQARLGSQRVVVVPVRDIRRGKPLEPIAEVGQQ